MHNSKLPEFLYKGHDIPEILRLYPSELLKSTDFKSLAHARALGSYHDLITDRKFLSVLRKEFDCLYTILSKELPDMGFSIEGRRKSLVSTEKKSLKLINTNQSVDLLRDMFAFRIVLFGHASEEELIQKCYAVMNRIITYYMSRYTLCEEDPVSDTMSPDSPTYKEINIPKESGISTEYLYGVKDDILHPKKNGYQSLHFTLTVQPYSKVNPGSQLEIQLRTKRMDTESISGSASHSEYKKYSSENYSKEENNPLLKVFVVDDFSRLNIPGFTSYDSRTDDEDGIHFSKEFTNRRISATLTPS